MSGRATKQKVLVTMGDRNYLPQVKQLFSSAYHFGGWDGDFLFIANDVPEHELKWFKSRNIIIKEFQHRDHPSTEWFPPVYLNAFEVFTPFFKQWKQVVFIEGDIIIQGSLDTLARVKGFAAVPDIVFPKLENQFLSRTEIISGIQRLTLRKNSQLDAPSSLQLLKELKVKYDLSQTAFNAGVFALSTDIISPSLYKNLNNTAARFAQISAYGMQGAFNLVFANKWQKLPILFNYCFNLTSNDPQKRIVSNKAPVLHFASSEKLDKPWNDPASLYYKTWHQYLQLADDIGKKRVDPSPANLSLIWAHILSLFYKLQMYKNAIQTGLSRFKDQVRNSKLINTFFSLRLSIFLFIARILTEGAILLQIFFEKSHPPKSNPFPHAKIYYVVSKKDFVITIFSILSLNHFIPNLNYRLYFDFNPNFFHRFVIEKLLTKRVRVSLLETSEVENTIFPELKNFSYAKAFFDYGWSGKKFFIPLFLEKTGQSLLIDSDTLFFDKPTEIVEWLKKNSKKMGFLSDYAHFSVISFPETDFILNRPHTVKYFNSGLLLFSLPHFHKNVSMRQIDDFIKMILQLNGQRRDIDHHANIELKFVFPLIEQSLHTLIAEVIPSFRLNKERYQVFPEHKFLGKEVSTAIFMHFTGDFYRYQIYRYLWVMLLEKVKRSIVLKQKRTNNQKPWYIFSREICIKCRHPFSRVEVV